MAICFGKGARRHLNPVGHGQLDLADNCGAKPHGVGGVGDADLDLKRPGGRIGLGCDLADPAGRLYVRVVREGDLTSGRLRRFGPKCPLSAALFINIAICWLTHLRRCTRKSPPTTPI